MLRMTRFASLMFFAIAGQAAIAQTTVPSTVLQPIWRNFAGGNDYFSANASERNAYPDGGGMYMYGTLATPSGGGGPLWRLFQSSSPPPDNRDWWAGPTQWTIYSSGGVLGYAWNNATAVPGLSQFIDVTNGHDHATIHAGETISGYGTPTSIPLWGYARYNNLTWNQTLNTVSSGGVTVSSSSLAGGAIFSWQWNGTEFLSTTDFGREIQSSISWNETPSGPSPNPTEAGSQYSGGAVAAKDQQGSPTLLNVNYGNEFQSTRAVPLEWNPGAFGGGQNLPVIYPNMVLGKDLYLNYQNLGSVAQYVTVLNLPNTLDVSKHPQIEIPTGYLLSNFNAFYTYDAGANGGAGQLTSQPPPNACITGLPYEFIPASGFGGVIISDSTGAHAMGVYGVSPGNGGSVDYFTLWNFLNCNSTTKFSAVHGPSTFQVGAHYYTAYIVSDTLSNVQAKFHQLYQMGAR